MLMQPAVQASAQASGDRSSQDAPLLFDPHRRAASEPLRAAVRRLAADLEATELELGMRRRARSESARAGFALAVEALACNLAVLCMMRQLDRPLAVPRSNDAMRSQTRYGSPVFGEHFRDVLHAMAHPKLDLIEDLTRGFKFAGSKGLRSTVRPTSRFAEWCAALRVTWDALTLSEEREVLVLKGKKDRASGEAELLEYKDTTLTRKRRKQVQVINAFLSNAPIIVPLPACLASEGEAVDLTRRTVRRIFNNGSWFEGGRLYDAFWETMRREDRFRFIRIANAAHPEGEPIANVDHAQLFPRLAYLKVNAEPPSDDLYDVDGNGSHREGYKRLTNALLLSKSLPQNWPEGLREQFPHGTKLKDTIAAIQKRHSPIAHLFGSGAGFRLMLIESEMLIAALLRLYSQGIVALPLHDSVLVAASQAGVAQAAMEATFEEMTGSARACLKTSFS